MNVEGEEVKAKNVAAVVVTATLPPFARSGSRDRARPISAIGDAKSLLGGTLVLTPLLAADGNVYAVAQGDGDRGRLRSRGGTLSSASMSLIHEKLSIFPIASRYSNRLSLFIEVLRIIKN